MNNVQLQNLILDNSERIAEAISTGAAWEIWMQVELVLILRAAGVQAAREVPYPRPNERLSLDVLAQDNDGRYAMELKVESANNSGRAIINGIDQDRHKLLLYPQPNPGARCVIGIAYSAAALRAMEEFASIPANVSIVAHRNGVAVLIAIV